MNDPSSPPPPPSSSENAATETTTTTTTTTTERRDERTCASSWIRQRRSAHQARRRRLEETLIRIRDLETRIHKSVLSKRRRGANVLDSAPSHRDSHLRLHTSHRVDRDRRRRRRWTLVVEGRTLVEDSSTTGDAESPERAEERRRRAHRDLLAGRYDDVEGPKHDGDGGDDDVGSKHDHDGDNDKGGVGHDDDGSSAATTTTTTTTTSTRSFIDAPIVFTHHFDRIVASFQRIVETTISPPPSSSTTPDVHRGGGESSSSRRQPQRGPAAQTSTTTTTTVDPPRVLTWTRQRPPTNDAVGLEHFAATEDAHAFHCVFDEKEEEDDDDQNQQQQKRSSVRVVARVELYRRWHIDLSNVDERYKPSDELVELLLPNFVPRDDSLEEALTTTTESGRSSSSSGGGSSSKKKSNKKAKLSASVGSGGGGKKAKSSSSSSKPTVPSDVVVPAVNSFHIPQTLTMKEAVTAVFLYAQEKGLRDRTDASVIDCDETLTTLFGLDRVPFSRVRDLLLERGLLTLVTRTNRDPVEITYVMTEDGATPWPEDEKITATTTTTTTKEDDASTTETAGAKRKRRDDDDDDDRRRAAVDSSSSSLLPRPSSSLVFNVNAHVPSPLRSRLVETLRRVKRREIEYTSSRTKALKTLASGGDHDARLRALLEEVVAGAGARSSDGVPVCAALARAAPAGSEARNAAHLDARTIATTDRARHRAAAARACRDAVDACVGWSGDDA